MPGRGRPRAFDRETALTRAMVVFWEHGYEGASLTELTTAMGINSPSLYSAFGSKEQLFREAVAHYGETEGGHTEKALRELPTARAALAEVLRANVRAYADPATPRGCMIVLAATTYTDRSEGVRDHLAEMRRATEQSFRERVERGIAEGDVPANADAAKVGAFYNAVLQGLSIQSRDGADEAALSAVAEAAVAAWDTVTAAS
ncbi:TetR/AcrR family transcriptional regulator [Allokutzneria sp. NRRL B-24872]|uniref:TetR/AcrR family transcriptional regulator n=1 Tax=Allokutzneria sp. NRRL B-24872 TaxID=1137961 RepID=UPI000A3C9E0F|nr:TetR/AcrR family transcriptional regulator [Allokutzneria sp. NRRL B-24872]